MLVNHLDMQEMENMDLFCCMGYIHTAINQRVPLHSVVSP